MLAVTTPQALTFYALALLGVLTFILATDLMRAKSRRWRVSRIKLCECKECHLLFLIDRFDTTGRYECPRCKYVNEKRRHSKSPWGASEEAS